MNQKELKELIEFLIEKDIAEFELERGDVKVRIKRAGEAVAPAAPDAPLLYACTRRRLRPQSSAPRRCASPPALLRARTPPAPEEGLHIVRSPLWARSTSRLLPDLRLL